MRAAPRPIDRLLRSILTAGRHLVRRRGGGPNRPGAHAAAFTASGHLILVKLRYAPGWRLPGGGREPGETLEDAALRELREEIGMISHGAVRAEAGIVIVEQVVYRRPRWSWEVESVCEAALDRLPGDLSPRARDWLERLARRR